jgi:hypothetical protein
MKYIKKFESTKNYQIGDYVLIDIESFKKNDILLSIKYGVNYDYPPLYEQAKIYMIIDSRNYAPYRVKFYDDRVIDIEKKYILRLLTSKEIEEYESKKASIKYNL